MEEGAGDEGRRCLARGGGEDSRVSVVRAPPGGVVDALEAGRKSARGRYLARMDADDIAEPTRFAEQLALLEGRSDLPGVSTRGCCSARVLTGRRGCE